MFPGVSVETLTERTYPAGGDLAPQVLGYVGPITAAELRSSSPRATRRTPSSARRHRGVLRHLPARRRRASRRSRSTPPATRSGPSTNRPATPGTPSCSTSTPSLQSFLSNALAQDILRRARHPRPRARGGTRPPPTAPRSCSTRATGTCSRWRATRRTTSTCGRAGSRRPTTTRCSRSTALNNNVTGGLYTPGSTFKLVDGDRRAPGPPDLARASTSTTRAGSRSRTASRCTTPGAASATTRRPGSARSTCRSRSPSRRTTTSTTSATSSGPTTPTSRTTATARRRSRTWPPPTASTRRRASTCPGSRSSHRRQPPGPARASTTSSRRTTRTPVVHGRQHRDGVRPGRDGAHPARARQRLRDLRQRRQALPARGGRRGRLADGQGRAALRAQASPGTWRCPPSVRNPILQGLARRRQQPARHRVRHVPHLRQLQPEHLPDRRQDGHRHGRRRARSRTAGSWASGRSTTPATSCCA